jgi:hypothetical protein
LKNILLGLSSINTQTYPKWLLNSGLFILLKQKLAFPMTN